MLFIDSLGSHGTWCLWAAHHFANIHYTSNNANRNHESDDQIANPDLAAAILLRGSCEIGLLVEEDWHYDEADATDAASEQRQDHVYVGEEGRHSNDRERNGQPPEVETKVARAPTAAVFALLLRLIRGSLCVHILRVQDDG